MRITNAIVACSMLVSTATFAEDYDNLPLASTICFPAIQALQEPTTEANLTFPDAFNDEMVPAFDNHPHTKSLTAATIAYLIIEAIGKQIGNRVFDLIFPNGAKTTLTEQDLQNIKKVVLEALREDTIRKLNECVTNIQKNNLKMVKSFQKDIALDLHTTTGAVYTQIMNFDHVWSQLAMIPSGLLISSLNLGLTQELVARGVVDEKFFNATKEDVYNEAHRYATETDKQLLPGSWDEVTEDHLRIQFSYRKRCPLEPEGDSCMSMYAYFWGTLGMQKMHWECESDTEKSCASVKRELRALANNKFINMKIDLTDAVYAIEEIDGKYTDLDDWKKQIRQTPAKEKL